MFHPAILAACARLLLAAPWVDDGDVARDWTVLLYGGSDNDSEESFCPDVGALCRGLPDDPRLAVLCLVDRSARYSNSTEGFGEDFADTRLYRLTAGRAERLDGRPQLPGITADSVFEADSGDATLVRDSIRYAKAHYPARHYAMVFYTHGNGWTWCPDETDGGALYPAELGEVLTDAESLDVVVFDVCEMASLEDIWQWRPRPGGFAVDVMVATPMAGFPFPWGAIMQRLHTGPAADGEPARSVLADLSPEQLGTIVVEETGRHRQREYGNPAHSKALRALIANEAMSCVKVARVAEVKRALDALATLLGQLGDEGREILSDVRGSTDQPQVLTYSPGPYYADVYSVGARIRDDEGLPEDVRALGADLATAVDALVVTSFGGTAYEVFGGFRAGAHGVQLVFPPFCSDDAWQQVEFLSPDPAAPGSRYFGRYDFCRDAATPGDGEVSNWFELLDLLFDADDEDGGRNGYVR